MDGREILRQRKLNRDYHYLEKELQLGDREYYVPLSKSTGCFLTLSTNPSSDVMEEDAILVSTSTREAWNESFTHYIPLRLQLRCPGHTLEI